MQRIERLNEAEASPQTARLLDQVKASMGKVPNIVATLARSNAALGGYLGFSGALAQGSLSPAFREQIALATAGVNRCDYCASAHNTLAGLNGLSDEEIRLNLQGRSANPKVEAALVFVRRVVETRGHVEDADLDAVRAAGYSDDEVVELIANTVLNIFTNYFNHIAGTEIDFPVVRTAPLAA